MLCDAKEIALGVGHRCPLHVWVLVQHMPARGRAELLQASDLDSSLPPRDGQVKVHHLTISPATGGGLEEHGETTRLGRRQVNGTPGRFLTAPDDSCPESRERLWIGGPTIDGSERDLGDWHA
jgi:hypothetical protein